MQCRQISCDDFSGEAPSATVRRGVQSSRSDAWTPLSNSPKPTQGLATAVMSMVTGKAQVPRMLIFKSTERLPPILYLRPFDGESLQAAPELDAQR